MSNKSTNPRLCIWCATEYHFGDSNADECFCASCRGKNDENILRQTRVKWMAVKLRGQSPAYLDLGQEPNDPWPPQFPVMARETQPSEASIT